jgi:hypothetical protein
VLLVEHDREVLDAADQLYDFGPVPDDWEAPSPLRAALRPCGNTRGH